MDISLIAVPIMYGCDRQGAQYGPEKLRQKGILDTIKKYKENVYDLGNLYIPHIPEEDKYAHHKKIKYLKPVIDINTNLAHSVFSALSSNSFPFIIGGDHSIGLGSISGSSEFHNNLAVIWVDAHGDINTHETSPSGNAHGMPLGASLGAGESSLVNVYYDGPKVKPENVFIVGARDLDEGEIKLAEELNLNLYTMDNIKMVGLKSVIHEIINKVNNSNVDAIHLSFDIDALDKSLVPGTGTPVENGFNLEEGKLILKEFLNTGLIKSMDLVELNPHLDENDITANLCIDLVDWIFKNL
ncbi:arginase [Clostridium sp. Cult2]|uniref:arginase n=1 Tax=Clostridium sp. Cult2 TaxID=2079003 RepID=UPI001F01F1D5|nr:arginase [Clostridium sp. Cult2]MCF6464610.1 arginase [Clostridium sp. Cult2]